MNAHARFPGDTLAMRTRAAFLSLSNAQRRLAHRCKREAEAWEARGHYRNFADCRLEANRLWREAKFNLNMARQYT